MKKRIRQKSKIVVSFQELIKYTFFGIFLANFIHRRYEKAIMIKKKITFYLILLSIFIMNTGAVFSAKSQAQAQTTASLDWTSAGRAGGAHVFSAESLPEQSFGLGFKESYFQARTIPYANTNFFHSNQIFISYVPFSSLQLFLNREGSVLNNKIFFPAITSQYFSKTEIGTQYSMEIRENYSIGLAPTYTFFNANGVKGMEARGLELGLLNTYKTHVSEYPLRFHLNLSYFNDQSEKLFDKFDFSSVNQNQIHGISRFDAIHYGMGFQLEAPAVHPYVEYTMDQMLSSKVPFFQNPNKLTVGSKILPKSFSNIQFDLGADLGLTTQRFKNVSITPQFKFFAGIAYILPGKTTLQKRPEKRDEIVEKEKKEEEKKEPPQPKPEKIKEEETGIKKIKPLSPEELKKYPISRAEAVKKVANKKKLSIPEITTGIPAFDEENAPEDAPLEELEDRNTEQDSPDGDFIRHFR